MKFSQVHKWRGGVKSFPEGGADLRPGEASSKKEIKCTFDVEDVPGGRNMTARMQTSWKTPPK